MEGFGSSDQVDAGQLDVAVEVVVFLIAWLLLDPGMGSGVVHSVMLVAVERCQGILWRPHYNSFDACSFVATSLWWLGSSCRPISIVSNFITLFLGVHLFGLWLSPRILLVLHIHLF